VDYTEIVKLRLEHINAGDGGGADKLFVTALSEKLRELLTKLTSAPQTELSEEDLSLLTDTLVWTRNYFNPLAAAEVEALTRNEEQPPATSFKLDKIFTQNGSGYALGKIFTQNVIHTTWAITITAAGNKTLYDEKRFETKTEAEQDFLKKTYRQYAGEQ
jgi:hypothetical protein